MPIEVIEIPCERLTRRKAFGHMTLAPEAMALGGATCNGWFGKNSQPLVVKGSSLHPMLPR
jgi:hypothetical protein